MVDDHIVEPTWIGIAMCTTPDLISCQLATAVRCSQGERRW